MSHVGRQHVTGVVTRIDGHEPYEAAQQEARPDQQHEGQRHLRHRQRSPGAIRRQNPEAAGSARASFAEGPLEVQPRPRERRDGAEHQPGDDRQSGAEREHRAVDGDLIEPGNVAGS